MDEATYREILKIKKRLCKICRADSRPTCFVCRLHEFTNTIKFMSEGMSIRDATEMSEERAKHALENINYKHDEKYGGRG